MESESQHIEIGGICCEAAFFKHTVCAILCTALKGQTEAKRRPSAWAVVLTSGTLDCRESKLTGLRHCQDRLWAKRGGPKKCSFSERERDEVCVRGSLDAKTTNTSKNMPTNTSWSKESLRVLQITWWPYRSFLLTDQSECC